LNPGQVCLDVAPQLLQVGIDLLVNAVDHALPIIQRYLKTCCNTVGGGQSISPTEKESEEVNDVLNSGSYLLKNPRNPFEHSRRGIHDESVRCVSDFYDELPTLDRNLLYLLHDLLHAFHYFLDNFFHNLYYFLCGTSDMDSHNFV
jgi:hypothetical protein